ncbi:DNA methyltransferase [Alicyclobacillus tolerans]|uniref:DNA methyltransferase n=1 Tax=Alicyclobacillus tolerans TaxID=90970 RepID=UPI003B81E515
MSVDKYSIPAVRVSRRSGISIEFGDSLDLYHEWERPTVIISDGPYGVKGFPGDPVSVDPLPEMYEPHIRKWSEYALPSTTLWFWNTELGWATVHPILVKYGWEYRSCHVWNKGLGHVAGNANSKTLRKFPVVTEVCVQYVRSVKLPAKGYKEPLPLKDWLRAEWERTGLPLYKTNEVCGVKNAATRKYFTKDHLWYFPPSEAFQKLADYANEYGNPEGRPYFSADGKNPLTGGEWELMRAKFTCLFGVNNVWDEPPIRGQERVKIGSKALHLNQKPLSLTKLIIESSSDEGDVVWEPFGGMCTGAIASLELNRRCYSAEILPEFYDVAAKRLEDFQ